MLTWDSLPRELLIKLFSYLDVQHLGRVAIVCRNWYLASGDDLLWKTKLISDFGIKYISCKLCHNESDDHTTGFCGSWRSSYEQIVVSVPRFETDHLVDYHHDQVLHVSYSHNGRYFSTCSKDGHVILWNARHPVTVKHRQNMASFSWKYTQFSEFNSDDSLLLVSGVLIGEHTVAGEIAVFSVYDGRLMLCSRINNKPYDIFGAWFSHEHVLSGDLRWLNHQLSVSQLWLNRAYQAVHSEHISVVQRIFRFFNSTMHGYCRMLRVARFKRPSAEPTSGDADAASDDVAGDCQVCNHQDQVSNSHIPDDDTSCDNSSPSSSSCSSSPASGSEDISEDDEDVSAGDGNTNSNDYCSLLIFTTGTKTFVPHQIGFKWLTDLKFRSTIESGLSLRERAERLQARSQQEGEQDGRERPRWFVGDDFYVGRRNRIDEEDDEDEDGNANPAGNPIDWDNVQHLFHEPDHLIDMHGHIIGLCLSTCQRFLYVNTRAWPTDCVLSEPFSPPPPIAQEIEIRVIDLRTIRLLDRVYRSHRAFTANDGCFFLFIDADEQWLTSGAEDCRAYLWHRCAGVCLATYQHRDVVNAAALEPHSAGVLVTVSDDASIKVWRSWRNCRNSGIDTARSSAVNGTGGVVNVAKWHRQTKFATK